MIRVFLFCYAVLCFENDVTSILRLEKLHHRRYRLPRLWFTSQPTSLIRSREILPGIWLNISSCDVQPRLVHPLLFLGTSFAFPRSAAMCLCWRWKYTVEAKGHLTIKYQRTWSEELKLMRNEVAFAGVFPVHFCFLSTWSKSARYRVPWWSSFSFILDAAKLFFRRR